MPKDSSACLPDRRSGIADINAFSNAPLLLMYGFMCVAATAALWDNLATYLQLPVSTTHTTGAALRLIWTLCCVCLHSRLKWHCPVFLRLGSPCVLVLVAWCVTLSTSADWWLVLMHCSWRHAGHGAGAAWWRLCHLVAVTGQLPLHQGHAGHLPVLGLLPDLRRCEHPHVAVAVAEAGAHQSNVPAPITLKLLAISVSRCKLHMSQPYAFRVARSCTVFHHDVSVACSYRVVDPVHHNPCAHSALATRLHTRLLGEDALLANPPVSPYHMSGRVLQICLMINWLNIEHRFQLNFHADHVSLTSRTQSAAMQAMPVLIGGMIWLIVAFIIQTGSKNKTWKEFDDSFAVWVGAACAVGAGLFTLVSSSQHA